MAACPKSIELIEMLEAQEALKLRGFSASYGSTESVVVDRWGHVRGLWHIHKDQYFWTGGASSQPCHVVPTLEEAVAYTMRVIATA